MKSFTCACLVEVHFVNILDDGRVLFLYRGISIINESCLVLKSTANIPKSDS